GTPTIHDALRKACVLLPDKGSREAELTFADSRLNTFAVGHLEHRSVRKSLVAISIFPAESNHQVMKKNPRKEMLGYSLVLIYGNFSRTGQYMVNRCNRQKYNG
ncbi:unnamed protein product, partial [Sphacelaria rigidula]